MSDPSHEAGNHLSDLDIAAYIDRGLDPLQRNRVEDHLSACSECRQHLLETSEVLNRVSRPRRLLVGGTVVAAAAALVFLVVRPDSASIDQRVLTRSVTPAVGLRAYAPIGPANRRGLRFVWSAATGAESYRLTISRADASPIWSFSGVDTLAVLPDSVTLRSSERYFWVVDALLSDGTTSTTGLREFGLIR